MYNAVDRLVSVLHFIEDNCHQGTGYYLSQAEIALALEALASAIKTIDLDIDDLVAVFKA